MFLFWLNITVATVFEVLWYLVESPPPASADGSAGQKHSPSRPPPKPIQPTGSRPVSRLFALIIGIDKYQNASPDLKNLNGAVADADDVKAYLQDSLGVPDDQIKVLQNQDATRDNIEKAIEDIGKNTAIKMDDPILIYYAGHGAEADAPPGWPTGPNVDGKIQMLVPHDFIPSGSSDSRQGQGILDMRLSYLLQDLAEKKSDNITVILDCCHSASGTRTSDNDPTSAARGIVLPKTYSIPEDLLDGSGRASVTAEGFEKAGLSSHVLLAACKAKQTAWEKERHGLFTSALLTLLKNSGVDKLTYKDLIKNLPDLPAQNPQCEGIYQSRCLFNAKVASPQRELYSISALKGGQYELKAGEAHGVTKNAQFAVFADKSMASAELGTVVVSTTTAFTATCNFSARGDEQPFPLSTAGGYALQTRVGEGQDVRLFIKPDDRFIDVFKLIAGEMQAGKGGLHLVNSRDDEPDLVVAADSDWHGLVHFEIMDKICRQYGLTHMPFDVIIDPDSIYHILQCSARFYWHLHRSSNESTLAGGIKLECMKVKEVGYAQPMSHGDNLNIGGVITIDVNEDAIYGFKVTNTTLVPLYVSMFYFDVSDLSIEPYYKPGIAKDGHVDFSLLAGGSLTIGYGESGTRPYRYTLREGQDVDVGFLKLFFSTESMDLSGIEQLSPFTECRKSVRVEENRKPQWDTMCVAVVQKQGGGAL